MTAAGEGERPWLSGAGPSRAGPGGAGPRLNDRQHAPATLRNRDPIAAVLRLELPPAGLVLEVASGSGEHIIHFARLFPALDWQPTDPDEAALGSIAAWASEAKLANLRAPLRLDAAGADWPVTRADALLCSNMVHISPWAATLGLFAGAARMLPAGAPLILYGPYIREGVPTAPGNLAFDADLRRRNPAWGLRKCEDMEELARSRGFRLAAVHDMPANNLTLVFRKA